MEFQFTHTAELEFPGQTIELDLIITAEYTPASRGSRGTYGEQEEPDEDATMQILSITDKAWKSTNKINKSMEHSQFIEDFGLPIIGVLIFVFGILIGLFLSSRIDKD